MAQKDNDKTDKLKKRRETLQMKAAGVWDVVADAVTNFGRNGDGNQAAAIALYAILSAIPLLILTMIAAGSFFSSNPNIQKDILGAVEEFHPYFSREILTQLGQIEGKIQVLGWIGVAGLVWLSAAIFNAVESALNIIFRSRKRRNYFVSKFMALGMIPLGWIIGGVSVFMSYVATLLASRPLILPGNVEISLTLPSEIALRYVIPYMMIVVLVTAVYKIIPTVEIRFSVAAAGSAIFALLLEIAKQFFTWYIANYTRYNVIFGSLETVVIIVIWVFYVALIFLFCAEIMSSRERRHILLLERALLKPHRAGRKIEERLFEKFGHTYPQGSTIFREGDQGGEMFYILSGRVRLERIDGSVQKTLTEIGPGQYFGEMSVLIDIRRSATARAVEDCHLAVIDAVTFSNLIRESQDVAMAILREFSTRLKNSNAALEEFTGRWTRMMIIIHFLNQDRAQIEEHIPSLAAQSAKSPSEIDALIRELGHEEILIIRDNRVMDVDRKKIWALFAGGMTK